MAKLFSIRGADIKEIGIKVLSIGTISVGGWIIFDKVREFLRNLDGYDTYWWLYAMILLYIGLIVLDLDKKGG